MQFTGSLPPDCHIAVGPNHVVQVVNSQISFYDKTTGAVQFTQASIQFFSGSGAATDQFDPRIMYDQYNSRWIYLTLALGASGVSQIAIAVSDDSNPHGSWNRFILNSALDLGGGDIAWLDYPMVGYSKDALVIGGNMFGSTNFAGRALVVRTAGLYDNTGLTAASFLLNWPADGHSLQPGETFTPSATTIYGINLASGSSVRLWAFTGVDTATPALTSTTLPVLPFAGVGFVPSGSSGAGLDAISDRVLDAMSRDNFFLAAHSITKIGDNKSSVRWYEVDMGSWPASGLPSMAQQGNITLGTGQYALMPAITKNSFGDISIIYTRSSTSIFSDLVVSTRVVSDPPGTMGFPTLLRSGLGSNDSFSSRARWGDYFAALVDPTDDATFWGDGQVTRADGFWATEIQSWTVTTGGPGGGGGVDYDVIALSTYMGAYNAGSMAEVTASDNLTFDVDSVLRPGQGHFGAIQADFLIAEPGANVTTLTFTVEGNVDPGVTATGMVFLWNWNTNLFEYGKAFDVQKLGNDLQATKIKDNPGRFVSNTGQVRMVFRAHDPFRRRGTSPSPFRLRTDLVKLNVKT